VDLRPITRDESRLIDRRAMDEYGIPGLVLMENAGRGVADVLESLGIAGPVAICCGKGNNAGDGFVVARHLDLRGYAVRVLVWADPAELAGDAGVNFQILAKSGVPILFFGPQHQPERLEAELAGAAWIVDALLGTGARGEPRPPLDAVIDQLNAAAAPILAIDLPSGLDCDTGQAARHTIRAAHTCTFVAPKRGFGVLGAAEYTGQVQLVDIGAPRKLIREVLAIQEAFAGDPAAVRRRSDQSVPSPMSRFRLLAIDIDGTLVNTRDELTPATLAALDRAGRSGIQVVLATGRRYSRTLHLVEPLGIDVPLVTASGALVKDPQDHRTLFRAEFEPGVLVRTMQVIAGCGYEPVLCGDTFLDGFDFYLARPDVKGPELGEYLQVNADCGRVVPDMLANPPAGVFAGFAMGTRPQMLQLQEVLERELPGRLTTHVLRSPKYTRFLCEVAPAGVTKWSAIRRLAGEWGIGDEAICAVGDDVNDIPMIRAAGLGVAMGNALPEVKAAADRIAPSQDDNGLVQVVEWLLE